MRRRERDSDKARYWQRTIGEAARSGMSIREFCRRRRLKDSRFYWWQRKLKAGRQERRLRRRSDRVKILYWDRYGWAIWSKRLEAGTFQFPFAPTGRKEVAAWELAVLLEGIDLDKGNRRKRYSLPAAMKKEETEKGGMETRAS